MTQDQLNTLIETIWILRDLDVDPSEIQDTVDQALKTWTPLEDE
jgi:hypothetical protein